MPHPTKKQKVDCYQRDVVTTDNDFAVSFDDLADVLPNILGFLSLSEIMRSRRINEKTREAATKTIVPPGYFYVDSVERYNTMDVMTRALPNLQQTTLRGLGRRHKYSDGEDPDEEVATRTAHWTTHDIQIISNFSKLRILEIRHDAPLNGRYPVLFSFPLLQKLRLNYCYTLKWDLEMLAGLPLLKELDCAHNYVLTGNISSLRVLKETLEMVKIHNCEEVEGNFIDLADFPHLKDLNLLYTAVTGDIRDIRDNDFSMLEHLELPNGVYGGMGYELQRISDGLDVIRAVYLFNKQRPEVGYYWYGKLSEESPDWYGPMGEDDDDGDTPPFEIDFAKAGSRIGYRWKTEYGEPCEVNWLDPEPDKESSDYGKYIEVLQAINSQVYMYRGFHQPPAEEEYHRLWEEYNG